MSLSPLSKYFLYLWWTLHQEKEKPQSHWEQRGKGKSEVPSSATSPALVCPLQPLFLQRVGCDYEIGSNATEDRCGVCLGDGSACQTVRKMFKQKEGSGNEQAHNRSGGGGEWRAGLMSGWLLFLADGDCQSIQNGEGGRKVILLTEYVHHSFFF